MDAALVLRILRSRPTARGLAALLALPLVIALLVYACGTRSGTSQALARGRVVHLAPAATDWKTPFQSEEVEVPLDGQWKLLSSAPDESGRFYFEAVLDQPIGSGTGIRGLELVRDGGTVEAEAVNDSWEPEPGAFGVRGEVTRESLFRFSLTEAGSKKIEALLRSGAVEVTIDAWGKPALGEWPEMIVSFNDHRIATFQVTAATYAPHVTPAFAHAGSNKLTIEYLNDYWKPPEDRNLYIGPIRFRQPASVVACVASLPWKEPQPPQGIVARYRPESPVAAAYAAFEPALGLKVGPEGWGYYLLGGETRPALPLAPPASVDFPVDVDRPAVLRLGVGLPSPAEETHPATVEFEVSRIDQDGKDTVLLAETLATVEDATAAWRDFSLDIPPEGKTRLRVTTRRWNSPSASTDPSSPALVLLSEPTLQAGRIPATDTRGVILISLDTLRADHLSVYGYQRETSPNLDAFARKYLRFLQPIAQSNWTLPSHISLFSSLYLSTHGLENRWSSVRQLHTVAEVLRDHGFRTHAMVDGGFLAPHFGFAHGFERYEDFQKAGFASILPAAEEWLRANGEGPFFLFLHTYDTHQPYAPPPPFFGHFPLPEQGVTEEIRSGVTGSFLSDRDRPERVARNPIGTNDLVHIVNLYDSSIVYMDHLLGPFLEFLEASPFWEELLVIITSDHGEAMMEHGTLCHGFTFYEELVRVPLLVRAPRIDGPREIAPVVELVDLAPTILEWAGAEIPDEMQGRSLMTLIAGGELAERPAHAEGKGLIAYRDEQYKFIAGEGVLPELYDLRLDPWEKVNLASRQKDLTDRLTAELAAFQDRNRKFLGRKVGTETTPSEDLIERLRDIGYVAR